MEDSARLGSRTVIGAHEFDRNAELMLALAYQALQAQTRPRQPPVDSVQSCSQTTDKHHSLQEGNR